MKPHDVLTQASNLIGERGQDYGGIEDNFANIASIYTTMTGKEFTPYDVAIIMVAVKMARIRQSPYKDDNYLDAINYLAFAHELRPSRFVGELTPEEEEMIVEIITASRAA